MLAALCPRWRPMRSSVFSVTLLSPVGPEPTGVYWRRRLTLLLVFLVVLAAVWFLFFRGGGGEGAASSTASPKPPPTSTASSSEGPSGSASESASPTGTPVCDDTSIGVSITLDLASVKAGDPLALTEGIQNIGKTACRRDIGAKANTIVITSGGYPVWSSDDCSPGGEPNIVVMKPGDSYEVSVTWEGEVTEGSCPKVPPLAKAGTYDAEGLNGGVSSKSKSFVVT